MKTPAERLSAIERTLGMLDQFRTVEKQREIRDSANFWALYSIISEVARKVGLPASDFSQHFNKRRRYFHDQLLQSAEEAVPRRSGELDDPTLDEVPTDEGFPPLPFR